MIAVEDIKVIFGNMFVETQLGEEKWEEAPPRGRYQLGNKFLENILPNPKVKHISFSKTTTPPIPNTRTPRISRPIHDTCVPSTS